MGTERSETHAKEAGWFEPSNEDGALVENGQVVTETITETDDDESEKDESDDD